MPMWMFPSGDLHFVTAPTAPATMDVRVMTRFPEGLHGAWTDPTTIQDMRIMFRQITPAPAAPGAHHAIADLTGNATTAPGDPLRPPPGQVATVNRSATPGTSFHIVVVSHPGFNKGGTFRVSTHGDVAALVGGDRTLSIFAEESDRVVTVYARFTDSAAGVVEDVTGHPWLKYEVKPADLDIATIDSEGRIHGKRAGRITFAVMTWDDRFRFEVALTVRPPLSQRRPEVISEELVKRTSDRITTLYVLSEGYTDQRRFFDHARKVVKSWIATRPFKQLSARFHAIAIFDPSVDRGVTIASRLVAAPAGSPAERRGVWQGEGSPVVPPQISLARDTMFGLMMGSRLSTPVLPAQSTPTRAAAAFVVPDSARVTQPDDRRLPRFGLDGDNTFEPLSPELSFASFVGRYIESAGHQLGDDDRVAFLVDDDVYGGLHIDVLDIPLFHRPMVAVSVGRTPFVENVVGTGPIVDRTITGPSLHADAVGSMLAHELGHSYRLGDEYEDVWARSHDIPDSNFEEIETRYENIQHDRSLRIPLATGPDPNPLHVDTAHGPNTSRLDVTRIKWNIHRVAKISPARSIAAVPAGFRLALRSGQAKRWKPGERAFLRNSLVVPKRVWLEPRTTAIAIDIIMTNVTADTVDIRVPAGFDVTTLGARPLLYVPKRTESGVDVGLIDPNVLAFLANQGPFPKGRPCLGPADISWNSEDRDCPPIPGFSRPSNNADAIGLYEGGSHRSCDIYRPAGRCKMRKLESQEIESTTGTVVTYKPVILNFCYVCCFVIVDLVDPALHEALDAHYPRDC